MSQLIEQMDKNDIGLNFYKCSFRSAYLVICTVAHGVRRNTSCITTVWKFRREMQHHQYFRLDLKSFMRPTPESLRLGCIPWKISFGINVCEKHRESEHALTRITFTAGIMGNRRCALIERTGVPLTKAIKCSRRLADWSSQACSATQSASNFQPVYLHPQNKRHMDKESKMKMSVFWHVI